MRIRWFSADWQMSLRSLAARLRRRAFTEESGDGFLIERTRENFIEGRFVQKLTYQESFHDPFGRELTFDRVAYNQVEFLFYGEFPQIELRDAPRSTQAFTSRLLEVTDFSVSTSSLTVDPMQWAEAIRRKVNTRIVMGSVYISDLDVSPSVTGSMVLKSDLDVKEAFRLSTSGRRFNVDRVGLSWRLSDTPIGISLANTGSARIDEGGWDMAGLLRETLPESKYDA